MTGRSWTVVRTLLALLAVGDVVIGAWALAAPSSFYGSFPGGGRTWVSVDGPFNEHLVRDVGALNLALASVVVAAAWRGGRTLVRTASVASIAWSLPHLAYHVGHLGALPSASDRVANVVSLGIAAVAPVLVLWLVRDGRPDAPASTATA